MNPKSLLALALTLLSHTAFAQALPLSTVTTMPAALEESSGLIRGQQPGQWWSHNDSGGDPELICFDQSGIVIRAVTLIGVSNIDWEEVTADDSGYVYIGDFGNNGNTRQDLVIYRIPHPDLIATDSVIPEAIFFQYPDQAAFPPPATHMKFDMEAMVAYGDSLHLFSKNRTSPFDGYTRRYTLPTAPGTYTATLVDSFYTAGNSKTSYWVCGAALSPDKEHLFLISYPRAWYFSCFEGSDFFGGAVKEFTFPLTQKEGTAWAGNDTLFLTDELFNGVLGGKMYRSDMHLYTQDPLSELGPDTSLSAATLTLAPPTMQGASYFWSNGATTPGISVGQSGLYAVTVVAPNGCTATDSIHVGFTTSVAPARDMGMHVHHDSASGEIVLRYTLDTPEKVNLKLYDLSGKVGLPQSAEKDAEHGTAGEHVLRIQADLAPGLYWLRMEAGERCMMRGFEVW